jgi:hypothetical protein
MYPKAGACSSAFPRRRDQLIACRDANSRRRDPSALHPRSTHGQQCSRSPQSNHRSPPGRGVTRMAGARSPGWPTRRLVAQPLSRTQEDRHHVATTACSSAMVVRGAADPPSSGPAARCPADSTTRCSRCTHRHGLPGRHAHGAALPITCPADRRPDAASRITGFAFSVSSPALHQHSWLLGGGATAAGSTTPPTTASSSRWATARLLNWSSSPASPPAGAVNLIVMVLNMGPGHDPVRNACLHLMVTQFCRCRHPCAHRRPGPADVRMAVDANFP